MTIHEEFEQVQRGDRGSAARLLARHGQAFDRQLQGRIAQVQNNLQNVPDFVRCMAESLCWAKYADRSNPRFLQHAASYILDGADDRLDEATAHSLRWGPDRLRTSLIAFRNLYQSMRPEFNQVVRAAPTLSRLQQDAMAQANTLQEEGDLNGIGSWFFCAPFKIYAIINAALWDDVHLDEVLMPLGSQVERGFRELAARRIVNRADLPEGTGSLMDGIATIVPGQGIQGELATRAETRILHINSGIYLLGSQ